MTSRLDQFRVGDWVDIDGGLQGAVVFNSVIGDWSPEFPETDWSYMDEIGIMIRQKNGALIFHEAEYFDEGLGRIVHVEKAD